MTFAYSIEEGKPGATGSATRAMDELIWSVKPKPTQEQRKGLIRKPPRLLATLNKWLDAIKWQDAERLQFFARLAECHASIVRAPIELSPERQLELAVEAARQDALRRIELAWGSPLRTLFLFSGAEPSRCRPKNSPGCCTPAPRACRPSMAWWGRCCRGDGAGAVNDAALKAAAA